MRPLPYAAHPGLIRTGEPQQDQSHRDFLCQPLTPGYLVAAVDHTYESTGTAFPDGRTLGCFLCNHMPADPAVIAQSRARDLSFVLDQLTRRTTDQKYAHMIDPNRIGMAGHSLGGDATLRTMAADKRVRAGANLDGTFSEPIAAAAVGGRPFLMIGTQIDHNAGGSDTSWGTTWAGLHGWKRWLTVAGTVHFSFTDVPVLSAEAGLPTPNGQTPPARWTSPEPTSVPSSTSSSRAPHSRCSTDRRRPTPRLPSRTPEPHG
ncbi:hypothetical protein ABH925_006422 [Streptacidiphilus sp. EB129]